MAVWSCSLSCSMAAGVTAIAPAFDRAVRLTSGRRSCRDLRPCHDYELAAHNGRRKHAEVDSRPLDFTDDVDGSEQHEELNIRVRETEPPPVGKKSRIGGLLKDAPTSGLKNLTESVGGAVKGAARPLSGIFRRPGSRSGRQKEETSTTTEAALKVSSGTTEVRAMSPVPRFQPSEDGSRRSSAREEYDQVAATAPHLTPSQLHGLLQVDALAAKYPHMAKLEDIEVSQLSLYTPTGEDADPDPTFLTWDVIFASTSSEMRQDWVQDEDSGDEGQDPAEREAISLPHF